MDPVIQSLRHIVMTMMLHSPDTSEGAAKRRLTYLFDDIDRGHVATLRYDMECFACALLARLPSWQLSRLTQPVMHAYNELRESPPAELRARLAAAVDTLGAPPDSAAQREALEQALGALCALVIPLAPLYPSGAPAGADAPVLERS